MAFDTVRVRKVRKDDEDSFLDWDGKATLFDEADDEADDEEVVGDPDAPEDFEEEI